MIPQIAFQNLLRNVSRTSLAAPTNLFHTSFARSANSKPSEQKNVAVVLCGCGALDGTEITEAVSIAIHLTCLGLKPRFYAPNIDLCSPVDHLTKDPYEPPRKLNALVEAARVARSSIKPLEELKACESVGLIIPGGFGAARTLSDFAAKGACCAVLPDLERVILEFRCCSKPIGTLCIASSIIAKVLPGAKVTLGHECPEDRWPYAAAIQKVREMGACVELRTVKQVTHCKRFNLYSNPAWLDSKASYADVHEGIGKMIKMMKKSMR
ncbi:hypothetical protein QAD02_023873 [Eretmocerus hayati]|uniref:Uncharacterized protein n=1 Tax=Eretmocerus hayati TaxID=131215 RepID=A0ACC2PYP0_9HYME|nr:hypothetical protein QAD02_023873 [Eretmocerus hayati]